MKGTEMCWDDRAVVTSGGWAQRALRGFLGRNISSPFDCRKLYWKSDCFSREKTILDQMFVSAYSRPISWRQKRTNHAKWDQGKEQRCTEYKWWEADVWCCRFIPVTAQAQTVGVPGFSEVWPSSSGSAPGIGWCEAPRGLQHFCRAHTCWPAQPWSLYQEGRERQPGWGVARTTNYCLHTVLKMCLSWWERWCPQPVPPQCFSGSGQWEKPAVPWCMPKS